MKTHNAIIYHCVRCGNVVHRDLDNPWPRCCGHEMAKAAAETICDESDESTSGNVPDAQAVAPPVKSR